MVHQLAMGQAVVEVASMEAGQVQGVSMVRLMLMVFKEAMVEAALEMVDMCTERMWKVKILRGAVDHVSLTVVVGVVVATLMGRLEMSLAALAGPMNATAAQAEDMRSSVRELAVETGEP
jgi:hypothetical protein